MGEAGITEPPAIEYPDATPFQSHHIKNRRTVFEELTRHEAPIAPKHPRDNQQWSRDQSREDRILASRACASAMTRTTEAATLASLLDRCW
jgi:hypothetical protein